MDAPSCEYCGSALETAATPRNPEARLLAHTLVRCPKCLYLEILDASLRPRGHDGVLDEDTFNAAMNSSPEMRAWAEGTLTEGRLQAAAERIAECAVAREWVIARGGQHAMGDLATIGRYIRSYDAKGYNTAPDPVRRRAQWLLEQSRRAAS
jgi:hypothetical protein